MEKIAEQKKYSIGDFLQHIFEPETIDELPESADVLRSWLCGASKQGTRPVEIIDAIYQHPAGISCDRSHRLPHPLFQDLSPPTFSPAYANLHPRDAFLLPPPNCGELDSVCLNSREGLEEWMVRGTLTQVEREAEALADGDGGLARGAGMSWDLLDNMSVLDQREATQTTVPVIWAIMSTIAFLHRPSRGVRDTGVAPETPPLANATDQGPKGQWTRFW